MRANLTKSFKFEAAQWLPNFPEEHKCRRMDGHSFHVDVFGEDEVPLDQGFLVDFGNLTSEMGAEWIWQELSPTVPLQTEIRVKETCTSFCGYRGD